MTTVPVPEPVKPGYLSSEMWLTLGKIILSLLVTLGVISQADMTTFAGMWATAVTAAAMFIANAVAVVFYVRGRTNVKTATQLAEASKAMERLQIDRLTAAAPIQPWQPGRQP
jgi:ABC-type phosphate transport system auxiliary subunit